VRFDMTLDKEFDELYRSYKNSDFGHRLLAMDGIAPEQLDVGAMSRKYYTQATADVSVDTNANANENVSINNYASEVTKGLLKLEGYYLLYHYAQKRFGSQRAMELIEAIWDGDVYFHDSSGPQIQQPYCFSYSTTMVMLEGRPYGQLKSMPPKRSDSFIAQVIEMTMDLSQDFAGAITPADMLVNYAWFAKREGLTADCIVNDLQKFVHVINNKFRMGAQSPFVNLSLFDRPNLEKVFSGHVYPDGSEPDFDYIMWIQRLFGNWFAKGDPSSGLPYRFPVVTLNLTRGEDREILDDAFLDWASEANRALGCFNWYVNDGTKLASCCRLVNDATRMQFRTDSFGNGGLNIGSHRVVTVNLPRLGWLSKDAKELYNRLQWALDICRDLLIVHREEILKRRIEAGVLKFYEPLRWFALSQLFSTIGIVGVYEMSQRMGWDLTEDDEVEDVLRYIEDQAILYSEKDRCSYNVEEIPGESAAVKLASKDALLLHADEYELYSNQYLPLIADVSVKERIETTGRYMDILSGGGILHLNIKEPIPDQRTMRKLVKYAVSQGVSHLSVNYGFGICENGHTSVAGTDTMCPVCGEEIQDWLTRIIGYFTRVSSWNSKRRDYEYERRVFM